MFSNPDAICSTWWNKKIFEEIWNASINSQVSFALTLSLVYVPASLSAVRFLTQERNGTQSGL